MPHKVTLYLDTSIPSQLFQPPEWMRRATIRFYSEVVPMFDIFVSEHVVDEIQATPDPTLREHIQNAVKSFIVLPVTEDAERLSAKYLEYLKQIKRKIPREDALHLAIASLHGIQCLVTWNMEHLAKEPTRRTVAYVNYLFNLPPLNIATPLDFLVEEE